MCMNLLLSPAPEYQNTHPRDIHAVTRSVDVPLCWLVYHEAKFFPTEHCRGPKSKLFFILDQVGYDKAAATAKKAHKEGTTLKARGT